MLRALTTFGSLASAASGAIAPVSMAKVSPMPDPATASLSTFNISYDFPYGGPTVDQYKFGVFTDQSPVGDVTYIDYMFSGCPDGSTWDGKGYAKNSVQLDSHYIGIKELDNSTNIARVYPSQESEIQTARLNDMKRGTAPSFLDWVTAKEPTANTAIKYEMDFAKNTYYFGGNVNPNKSMYSDDIFTNEITTFSLQTITDLLRVRVIDVFSISQTDGSRQYIRFDSEFFVDPQATKINKHPAIITNPFDVDVSNNYKPGSDGVTSVGHVLKDETIDPSFLVE